MSVLPVGLVSALQDRYRLDRELGQGGMATVYLAEDLKHHRQVAIKVLRPELAQSLGPERFLREIELAARLTHPHILPLHDSGNADGFLYYVMPFVEGESLRDRLTREKQLPLEDALQIAREVADALGYAHAHGVIHRDIKPENILLESGHAVVADFGIAKAITAAGSAKLTEAGLAVGTPSYMSPEQGAGEGDLDGRSDLYSLGCVLYEMLAGEPPYSGPTAQAIIAKRFREPVPRISTVRETVPPSLEAALTRALAKSPADRFATAEALVRALQRTDSVSLAPLPGRVRNTRRLALVAIAGAVALGGALLLRRGHGSETPAAPAHPRTAIAVLPFENLSAGGPNAYFAPGLHDELLTQLAQVAALTVISRTSVMGYAGTTTPLAQIANELGVGSVMEGSVQVIGDRLRVNVQLIDAATDAHLWAEHYDRTLDDAFAIQSDVAQQIVTAVGAALSGAEQEGLAEAPTANAEAYRLYLQGRSYHLRPGQLRPNDEVAQDLLERALALDPDFALAHAELSQVHGAMYWWRYDHSPARAARQREEAEAALRLAPTLPQAHAAMGLVYYWGNGDYQRALDEFAIALRSRPNDAELWTLIAYVHRRLGHWEEVDAAYAKAIQLDPRNADLYYGLGGTTFLNTNRYAEAVRAYDEALRLAPDLYVAAVRKGIAYVRWQGQLDTLRAALQRVPSNAELPTLGNVAGQQVQLLLWERQADSLLALLRRTPVAVFDAQIVLVPASLYAGWAHRLRGDEPAARAAFDSARVFLDSAVRARPDDWRAHAARGLALAGLTRRDEALAEARWLQGSFVYRTDAAWGPPVAEDRARILAQAGDPGGALDEIERLLGQPSWLSVHTLRLDPLWDPIRKDPRFQALLVKYAQAGVAP